MGSHGHGHGACSGHGATGGSVAWRLNIVLALTAAFMLVEFLGGLWTHSLALLSDSAHMLSDVASLAISVVALKLTARAATSEKTYGFLRAEVLAAFMNALALVILAGMIVMEALERFSTPQEILSTPMILIATAGLLVNLVGIKLLHSSQHHNLNLRGAYLHIMGDLLGSVAALISGVAIQLTGKSMIDTVMSLAIAVLIVLSGGRLLWDAVHILMQGAPASIDQTKLREQISAVPGVSSVDDLRLWSLGAQSGVATVHVTVSRAEEAEKARLSIKTLLAECGAITHSTVEVVVK